MVPSKPKFVVYYRVSTAKQGRSGLGLESQQATAQTYIAAMGGIELAQFVEVESGRKAKRPKLAEAIARCRQSRATLLVAKLDRLSRDGEFLYSLKKSDVKFQALDIPDANTLTLGVMIAMAQHEAEVISARTKAALAARKARGLPLGTPRDMSAYQAAAAVKGASANRKKAKVRAGEVSPQIDTARAAGHTSLRAIAAYLNEQSIPTPRGKLWTAAAVSNVIALI